MNISLARDYRSLNSYQKTRIVEFYYKNKDIQVKDIGKELNISDRAVRRVLKEENINTRLAAHTCGHTNGRLNMWIFQDTMESEWASMPALLNFTVGSRTSKQFLMASAPYATNFRMCSACLTNTTPTTRLAVKATTQANGA